MHPVWIAGAVILALYLVLRRREHGRALPRAGRRRRGRRRPDRLRRRRAAERREADRGRGPGARQVDLPRRRRARVPGDGRVHRPHRARRDDGDRRRAGRRPGRDLADAPDRDRLDLRRAGRRHVLRARTPARARLHGPPRRAREDHRGTPGAGRGVLRAARRHDDPDRPLHRAGARDRAVHRRRLEDAVAQVPPLRRARRRALGDDVLRARLRVLALVRQAHRVGLARAVRVQPGRRADRRDRVPRPAAAQPGAAGADRRVDRRAAREAAAAPGRAVPARGLAATSCSRWRGCRSGRRASSGTASRRATWASRSPRCSRSPRSARSRSSCSATRRRRAGRCASTTSRSTSPTGSTPSGSRTWRSGSRRSARFRSSACSSR